MIRTVSPTLAPRPVTAAPRATAPAGGPTGSGLVPQGLGDTLNLASSAARLYNGVKTSLDGGRAVKPDMLKAFKQLKNMRITGGAMKSAVTGMASTAMSMAQRSALFAGGVSAVVNGYRYATGQIGLPTFGGRVVGDTLGGLAGGAGAAIAGGLGMAVLGTVGLAGTALTVGGVLAGLAGYMVAENMVRRSSLFKSVVGTVQNALGGMSRPYRG